MSSSCQALLSALKDCLLHTDCVLKQGRLPSECLKEHIDELPEQCRQLRKATFECKRNMVRSHLFTQDYYLRFIDLYIAGHEEKIQREYDRFECE